MATRSPYADKIAALAPGYDPRHIEAFMRLEYSTLDHLTPEKFRAEVAVAKLCCDEDPTMGERCARSYGL